MGKLAQQFEQMVAANRTLAERFSSILKTKEHIMASRSETLEEFIAKGGSVVAVAKHITEKGSTSLTESEFSSMLMQHAKLNKKVGETDAGAFSRIFSDPASGEIRRAHQIAKNTPAPMMSIEPTSVEVTDINDAVAAIEALTEMAEEQRRRSKWTLSKDQAFARVFEDPDNAKLAARAHRRPQATMSM